MTSTVRFNLFLSGACHVDSLEVVDGFGRNSEIHHLVLTCYLWVSYGSFSLLDPVST